jgi:hypothetical protein
MQPVQVRCETIKNNYHFCLQYQYINTVKPSLFMSELKTGLRLQKALFDGRNRAGHEKIIRPIFFQSAYLTTCLPKMHFIRNKMNL